MLANADHYVTLQVDSRANRGVIQAAYRTLARKYHPDLAGGSEARMAALNSAWAVLHDPVARAAYDRARLQPSPAPATSGTEQAWEPQTAAPRGHSSGSVLDFGRYAGWSLGELARHDPNFLEWLARTPGGRRYRQEIESLLARPPAAAPVATATRRRARFRHR